MDAPACIRHAREVVWLTHRRLIGGASATHRRHIGDASANGCERQTTRLAHLVVGSLRQREVREAPPEAKRERGGEEDRFRGHPLRSWEGVKQLQLVVKEGEGKRAEHAKHPHEVVEAGAEKPLMHRRVLRVQRVMERQDTLKRAHEGLEHLLCVARESNGGYAEHGHRPNYAVGSV